ncbi:MFS transporter [Schumannella luteola]|uniref:Polyol permease family n=1 Tax=Schumannella luteola TaxID=472059 RepID=A0A852Y6J1_9MICO|nr:MFS transporter [Schumannella luteola]NYG97492.1 polyol permease family [Schumannella luteola]
MTERSGNAAARLLDRVGIPAPLFLGFVGVLLFMIGDGVESNYLSTFLAEQPGLSENAAAITISLYGIFVAIGSWFAGTLSSILGPRRVMLIGGIAWVVLEIVFLAVGIGAHVTWLAIVAYALRGIGYPFFAYAFLVWLNTATPAHQRGSSVGWFWFVFGAGLPTIGSLVASWTIPHIGETGTFWLATVIVAAGLLIAFFGVRDLRHAGPTQPDSAGAMSELAKGLTILWRDKRVAAGAFVRLVNTTPNFALFVVAPFFFVKQVGFTQENYLLIVTIVYTANIFANLFFGIIGDRFGWKRTVTWFGCVMCAVGVLALYYVPLAIGPNFWVTVICWAVFGIGLAGFVPLTALVPSMVKVEDRGSALAVYTLAAGLSAFVGPALVALLGGVANITALIWVFAGLYVVGAIVTLVLRTDQDPGQAKRLGAPVVKDLTSA